MKPLSFLFYIKFFWKLNKHSTAAVIILKFAVAVLYSFETVFIAALIDNIIDRLTVNEPITYGRVAVIVGVWILRRSLVYWYERCKVRLKSASNACLPRLILGKKMRLAYMDLSDAKILELMRRIGSNPTDKFIDYFDNILKLFEVVVRILGLLFIIALKSPLVALLVSIVLIPYYVVSVKNGKIDYEAYEESEEYMRRADYFKNVISDRKYTEERTLFGYSDYMNDRYSKEYNLAIASSCKANRIVFLRAGVVDVMSTFVVGVTAVALLHALFIYEMTLGLYISVVKSIINYVETISMQFAKAMLILQKGRLFQQDYMNFESLPERTGEGGEQFIEQEIQSIEFKDVSFSYPGSEQKVLDHISFCLEGGRQYAFVGENGAGKSTLVKLLLGFYTNYTGEIRINGRDIRQLNEDALIGLFSIVPQDQTRYEIQLEEYLKSDNKEEVKKVFDELSIDYLDIDKQNGLQISFGHLEEKGIELSGGQWQLLSIARSVLVDAPIYILDEPTASIDPVREAELYAAFQKIMQGKFAILITHRLGAAKAAEEIFVLGQGKILEKGNHEELMKQKGMYYQMYDAQRGWYDEKT
ncbi:MAG: ABC transporter ATP-binding protein [Agathobacter sp.]|nr:ABC transporter ATP-binding protein [Agathobacter sp.]